MLLAFRMRLDADWVEADEPLAVRSVAHLIVPV